MWVWILAAMLAFYALIGGAVARAECRIAMEGAQTMAALEEIIDSPVCK